MQRALRRSGLTDRDLDELDGRVPLEAVYSAIGPGEVAYLVGYADQTALQRAFRRWTGQTPIQYRTSLEGLR